MRSACIISALLTAMLLPTPGDSKWGPRGCAAQESVGSAKAAPTKTPSGDRLGKFEWRDGTATQTWLFRDGVCIGEWYHQDGMYYPWDGTASGKAGKPPIDPPRRGAAAQVLQAWQLSGVDQSKIAESREVVTYGGLPIDPSKLSQAFEGTLTDDSGKGYFVVIAKDQVKREAILAEWEKLPKDFRDRYKIWSTTPDATSMQDRFNGKPRFHMDNPNWTIVLETAKGKVLFRRPWSAEQAFQANDVKELLKNDPDYKPALDPGRPVDQSAASSSVPPIVWIIGGAAILLVLGNRKKP